MNLLSSADIILRPLKSKDRTNIFLLRNDPKVNKHLDRTSMASLEASDRFIEKIIKGEAEGVLYYWAITLRDNDELIGTICLWNFSSDGNKAEIGFEMLPQFQGRGYMFQAVKKIISFGFETLNLESIYAFTKPENSPSINLLSRCSFQLQDKGEHTEPELQKYALYSIQRST